MRIKSSQVVEGRLRWLPVVVTLNFNLIRKNRTLNYQKRLIKSSLSWVRFEINVIKVIPLFCSEKVSTAHVSFFQDGGGRHRSDRIAYFRSFWDVWNTKRFIANKPAPRSSCKAVDFGLGQLQKQNSWIIPVSKGEYETRKCCISKSIIWLLHEPKIIFSLALYRKITTTTTTSFI